MAKDILINRQPKLQVRMTPEERDVVDKHAEQNFYGNRSRAIRDLIERGIASLNVKTKRR